MSRRAGRHIAVRIAAVIVAVAVVLIAVEVSRQREVRPGRGPAYSSRKADTAPSGAAIDSDVAAGTSPVSSATGDATRAAPAFPMDPPPDGTYTMKGTTRSQGPDGRSAEEPVEIRLTFETLSRSVTEIRQRRSGSGAGVGFGGAGELIWRTTGLSVVPSHAPGTRCEPGEQLELKFPLRTGRSWQSELSCIDADGSQFQTKTDVAVARRAIVDVVGTPLETWELRVSSTTTGSYMIRGSSFPIAKSVAATAFVSDALGLTVKVTGTASDRTAGASYTTEFELALVDLASADS